MVSEKYYLECQKHMNMLYEEGRHGDMWCEAQAHCLESWLECSYEYDDDNFRELVMEDLVYRTEDWLEGMMQDCSEEELQEGGIYHWMRQALSEG